LKKINDQWFSVNRSLGEYDKRGMKMSYGTKGLKGEVTVPGDKSISHRSIMLGAIAEGETVVHGFLESADCISTVNCFKAMGVDISLKGTEVRIQGAGLYGLKKPEGVLDTGNSGTTTRIMTGLLAGQDFDVTVNGDESIRKRPMGRVIDPLTLMGAHIESENGNGCAPLRIYGSKLKGISYEMPVASAQVKSAILLAGLCADGETAVMEKAASRNHTELMLKGFGADVRTDGLSCRVIPGRMLKGTELTVPGDISSAAYFMGAALIVPGSEVVIKNVGINPTRDGIIRVFKEMGADMELLNRHFEAGEEVADIKVRYSELKGTTIGGSIIPALIDELPLIAVVATQAAGTTVIKDAAEMKVKESDRIKLMCDGLKAMGADITPTEDGMIINGLSSLHGAEIEDEKDHRIAMSFTVASLIADKAVSLKTPDCVKISYPEFYEDLKKLM